LIDGCVLRSGASVVGHGRQLSAQAHRDVGVERPPGHQGGVVQVEETVHFLSLLGVAEQTVPAGTTETP